MNDVVEIGSGANKVTIDGNNGTISTGNINMNGTNGMITADKITIDGGSGTIGGLTNTTWDADNYVSGQAASEDQLKTVYDTAVKYDVDSGGNINTGKITLEGSSGTTIGNVAAGEVSATSMDAVNGSQLYQSSRTSIISIRISPSWVTRSIRSALCQQRWQACIRASRTVTRASWPWLTAVTAAKAH